MQTDSDQRRQKQKPEPLQVAFCSVGHSLFSVSIVQFVRGKLNVVVERNDKVGGREMEPAACVPAYVQASW